MRKSLSQLMRKSEVHGKIHYFTLSPNNDFRLVLVRFFLEGTLSQLRTCSAESVSSEIGQTQSLVFREYYLYAKNQRLKKYTNYKFNS